MPNYKNPLVWEKAHELTFKIYQCTSIFPTHEIDGLYSQMRRSASSVVTNIAEGCGRESEKEFKRYLALASGSAAELDYQLILSKDLDYLSQELFNKL